MDKLRLRFEKTGRAIYISHLDLMHTMQRAFSRAGYALKYSEGFNPHPQISIALPLSVGAASLCEIMDFRLKEDPDLTELPRKLTAALPEGIEVLEAYEPERKTAQLKWLSLILFLWKALRTLTWLYWAISSYLLKVAVIRLSAFSTRSMVSSSTP